MENNVKNYSNIKPINAAIWDRNTSLTIKNEDEWSASFEVKEQEETGQGFSLRGVTINELMDKYNIPVIDILKVDIEGAEYNLIQGAKNIFASKYPMKVIMASYHKHNDEIILRNELEKNGFKTEYTEGYMLSTWDGVIQAPYVRRALIKAKK